MQLPVCQGIGVHLPVVLAKYLQTCVLLTYAPTPIIPDLVMSCTITTNIKDFTRKAKTQFPNKELSYR